IVVPAMLLQIVQEMLQGRVGVGDLAIVGILLIGLRIGRWRLVRVMWIVKVHPYKTRAGLMGAEPSFGVGNDVHAATFDPAPARFARAMRGEIVIEIKAAVESRGESFAIEDGSADEGCGVISGSLEKFCPGGMNRREWNSKIGNSVCAG